MNIKPEAFVPLGRYSQVEKTKSSGATYTPAHLAEFVADQMIRAAALPAKGKIRILDPACGDGVLLDALIRRLPSEIHSRLEVFGYDTDPEALGTASRRLEKSFPLPAFHIEEKDFLQHVLSLQGCGDLLEAGIAQERFHLVIANPPYVRTQIIGARQAQQLAKNFGLTGRVDLYYPFLLGISEVLEGGGIVGVITSNRFMTTKSGQAVRRQLLSRFQIQHVWDLGDSRIFDAAVLPSVLLAQGITQACRPADTDICFSSLYETQNTASCKATDALAALKNLDDTVAEIPDGRCFLVRHGTLDTGGTAEGVWRISTNRTDKWLSTVSNHTWDTFRRIGKIRVGVKSTADKVFIKNDWDSLPGGRPELLYPLITRHCARQFKAMIPANPKHRKEILYPHRATDTGRAPVEIDHYPKAASYLEGHREQLEARKYVIEAGRRWYELWVPQDPGAWQAPKLVFPDISEKPTFWIDTDGGIVNGECYWLRCEREGEQDLLWLALAVANSTFIEAYYDHRFNNKLYAGRRRFITQYVEQFPLPDPKRGESVKLISMAKEIHAKLPSIEAEPLIADLDKLVWHAFGLELEEVPR